MVDAASTADEAPTESEQRSAQGDGQPPLTRRRSLRRWTTDDGVTRIVESKLAGFDPFEVQSCRGKATAMPVDEFIGEELRKNRSSKTNLTQDFWILFLQSSSWVLRGSAI